MYLGDYAEDYTTLNVKFTSRATTGAPFTLGGTPVISVYKADGLVQTTLGITLTADFDGVTGLNNILIDLSSDAFYAIAGDYHIVITAGSVNSVSVVGEVVAEFSIENRFTEVDVTKLGGGAQSLTDLKDFADAGYDPGTNKVQGVILVDTVTTVTGGATAASISALNNLSAAQVNTEVDTALNTAIPGSPTTNSINQRVLAVDDLTQASGGGDLAAILGDTNELQSDWANGGRLDLILDAILAMLDDPRAEPGQGALSVNPDSMTKIDYIYKFLRNKTTQTSSTLSVFNDAGSTVDHKATVSDDGTTATVGEVVTGP